MSLPRKHTSPGTIAIATARRASDSRPRQDLPSPYRQRSHFRMRKWTGFLGMLTCQSTNPQGSRLARKPQILVAAQRGTKASASRGSAGAAQWPPTTRRSPRTSRSARQRRARCRPGARQPLLRGDVPHHRTRKTHDHDPACCGRIREDSEREAARVRFPESEALQDGDLLPLRRTRALSRGERMTSQLKLLDWKPGPDEPGRAFPQTPCSKNAAGRLPAARRAAGGGARAPALTPASTKCNPPRIMHQESVGNPYIAQPPGVPCPKGA